MYRSFSYNERAISVPSAKVGYRLAVLLVAGVYCLSLFSTKGHSFAYVWQLHGITAIGVLWLLGSHPASLLAPTGLTVILYVTAFAVAPVVLDQHESHSEISLATFSHGDVALGSEIALCGLICLLAGRVFGTALLRTRKGYIGHYEVASPLATGFGTLFLVLGLIGYTAVVFAGGGLFQMVAFDGARTSLFREGAGAWYWLSFLLVSGASLLSIAAFRYRDLWRWSLWLGLAILYFLYRGKDQVVGMLFCALAFQMASRGRPSMMLVCGVVIASVFAALVVENFRQAVDVSTHWYEALADVVSSNIEMLDAVSLAAAFKEKYGVEWGVLALVSWFEPVDRMFLGDTLPSVLTGVELDLEMFPEHYQAATAISPTLVGELYLGAGYWGVIGGMVLYGVAISVLEALRSRLGQSSLLVAAYPFALYMALKVLIDGTTNLFRLVIVVVPIALVALIRRWRPR